MPPFKEQSYSEAELSAEFDALFPEGFGGADVQRELAPNGWQQSPLRAVFHPTVEQLYEEAIRFHRNCRALAKPNASEPMLPEPTFEQVAREYRELTVDAEREVRELVGQCLWDVFSDGHEVFGPDGRLLDLGSFRASGAFLADLLNRQIGGNEYDYLSFYLGTVWCSQRADLTPVYQFIFARLRCRELDWVYHFPRLYAVDLRPLKEALESKSGPEWGSYDPSEALAKEQEQKEYDTNLAELRESLDQGYREAIEDALKRPPPPIVQAYQAVYGRWPRGWPPTAS
ncbi:MAG TPA: hypothetical protein VFA18_06855 [Gemmataceae bacterium]|nr:hypothetical protein [Gemmataceae bacterium]